MKKNIKTDIVADGRTEREKWLEKELEKARIERDDFKRKIDKLEIENNLMKQLLTVQGSYTYGIR